MGPGRTRRLTVRTGHRVNLSAQPVEGVTHSPGSNHAEVSVVSKLMTLFSELKRRSVLRIAAAYVVAAWLVIQVTETIFPLFGFDDMPARIVVIVLAIGFVPAMVLAWIFELTPEGLRKDDDLDRSRSIAPHAGKKLDRIIMVVLALALGYFAVDKFVLDPQRQAASLAQKADDLEDARLEGRSQALKESFDDNTVAVLPFTNLSPDPEQENFADGMTEELLNILAKIPSLRVTARTSSFYFKGRDLSIARIADALNVKHIIQGSIRRSGNRVRITAKLVDASSDTQLWSENYDRDLADVFAIQDEVSAAIASELVESFDVTTRRPVSRARNLAAYEAYRTGRLLWWRRSTEDFRNAIELFDKAIEADPGYAPAYAAAADTWLLLIRYGGVHFLDGLESAEAMIEKALAIDAESAEALAALGLQKLTTGDYDEAERALRKAIELDEEYIPARLWLSVVMGEHGRISEQGLVLQEAIARDPLNELLAVNYAGNLHVRGEYEQATHVLEGLLRLQPDSTSLNVAMWSLAANAGELVDAWRFAKRASEIDPTAANVAMTLSKAWVSLGEFAEAERVLLEGMERAKGNVDVKQEYVNLLLLQGRADEAEDRINRLFGKDVSHLPAEIQRWFHYDKGMVAAIRSDWLSVRDHFELALDPDEGHLYENNQIFILTALTQLHRAFGDLEAAEQRLSTAERVVGHARINGVDDGDIYYSLTCLLALRDQNERALQTLQQAHERGWRNYWRLERDQCLDPLRTESAFQAVRDGIAADVEQARVEVKALTETN
jgi:adenylate cyclase